jgi:hypothetical protein
MAFGGARAGRHTGRDPERRTMEHLGRRAAPATGRLWLWERPCSARDRRSSSSRIWPSTQASPCWRRASPTIRAERPGVGLVGGAALFYAVIGGCYYLSPADSTGILLLAAPIAALGWLSIGLTWMRR